MSNSNTPSAQADKVLKEVLEGLDTNEDALESHLPESVTKLDKAGLLAVIYRLLARVQ